MLRRHALYNWLSECCTNSKYCFFFKTHCMDQINYFTESFISAIVFPLYSTPSSLSFTLYVLYSQLKCIFANFTSFLIKYSNDIKQMHANSSSNGVRVVSLNSCVDPWHQFVYEVEPQKGDGRLWVHGWCLRSRRLTVMCLGAQQAFYLATLNVTVRFFSSGEVCFF